MRINFDLDGTIANLYGVNGWLDMLIAEDTTPYEIARPLVNMSRLARYLNRLTENGYEICVISWLCKGASDEYNAKVTEVKKAWLNKHLASVEFTEITIVPYGTPKHTLGNGILFDDEIANRIGWETVGKAYAETEIFDILKNLL